MPIHTGLKISVPITYHADLVGGERANVEAAEVANSLRNEGWGYAFEGFVRFQVVYGIICPFANKRERAEMCK